MGSAHIASTIVRARDAAEPFDPARTLFIDDTPNILEAAHRYGIRHLLTLLQPDSGSPARRREELHYPGIHHFDELLPALLAGQPSP